MSDDLLHRIGSVLHAEADVLLAAEFNRQELQAFLSESESGLQAATVLFGLVPRPEGLQVLLTKRSPHLRHHPGQISFPGGRREPEDASLFDSALREAQEEIALQPQAVRLLGHLEPMITITGFRVFPVVAMIDPAYTATPDGVEVETLFEAPLDLFLHTENEKPFQLQFKGEQRQLVAFDWQEHRIWGATASVLIHLRSRLQQTGWH